MKTLKTALTSLGCALLLSLAPAIAGDIDPARISRSVEQSRATPAADLDNALQSTQPAELSPLKREGYRSEPGPGAESAQRLQARSARACVATCASFWFSDAVTVLSRDFDNDGYYTRLAVRFDANTSDFVRYVYARIYLSYEGGPWNTLHTTRDIRLDGNSVLDEYEVITDLDAGYRTGYYDILIELYDAGTREYLASYGPNEDGSLRALPLEDISRDQSSGSVDFGVGLGVGIGVGTAAYVVGSGAWDGVGLLLLAGVAGWRWHLRRGHHIRR